MGMGWIMGRMDLSPILPIIHWHNAKQDCIPVGCILSTCCPNLQACTALGGSASRGGVCSQEGVSVPGGSAPKGGLLPGGVSAPRGWYPSMQWGRPLPPCTEFLMHATYWKYYFGPTLLRAVTITGQITVMGWILLRVNRCLNYVHTGS